MDPGIQNSRILSGNDICMEDFDGRVLYPLWRNRWKKEKARERIWARSVQAERKHEGKGKL
jgi:hypothetical protein